MNFQNHIVEIEIILKLWHMTNLTIGENSMLNL